MDITAGRESQRAVVMTTLAFWSCSDDHVGFLVLQSLPRWLSGPAVMSMLAFKSCSDDHNGFLVL
jgi:hypothetical protein